MISTIATVILCFVGVFSGSVLGYLWRKSGEELINREQLQPLKDIHDSVEHRRLNQESLIPCWRCDRCENWTHVELGECSRCQNPRSI